ncbi:tlde1 domain-containing protein [Pleomorphomonas oryzae]|uniref:tlde1 domain-containing protein n=1 Tax=Pleomorphomonas oryzae TaxID=261934 RepID=UPI0003FA2F91|nr:tlde1 domain-containing protein [Pleomorphomonas oryzae]
MATLAAYSSGYEPVSFRAAVRFSGLPAASAIVTVTAAATLWIGLSLTAVGTVSENLSAARQSVYDSGLSVRPLQATLAPAKKLTKFDKLPSITQPATDRLSANAILLSRQNKATAAVAMHLAEVAAGLRQQQFEARFQSNLSLAKRAALAVGHDPLAGPDAGVRPPVAVAEAPVPVPRPALPAKPVEIAPEVPKVAAVAPPAIAPAPPAVAVAPQAVPQKQDKPAAAIIVDPKPRTDVAVVEPFRRPGVAIYDITAGVVHMPNGEKLEAHSGLGNMMDDTRYIHVKMRGPTPPGTYKLTMRESLFHGVEAIRLTPVDGKKPFGRDGLLAHTYMLRRPGESNGCVSFRDYGRFLAAFKRGEVRQMVVVSRLGSKSEPKVASLFSWFKS